MERKRGIGKGRKEGLAGYLAGLLIGSESQARNFKYYNYFILQFMGLSEWCS